MFDDNGSFLLALFEFFLFIAWFMCLFWIFGDLFRSRDLGGWGKTVWALFIIILPLVGTLVYLIVRGGGMAERTAASQTALRQQQETYIRSVAGANGGARSVTDEISSAKGLLDSGAITEAEYARLKESALAKSAA
ncbi:SHOCT domain-containing protein [Actinoplanes sp. NPDC049596]|uniref:SHOCT domain-containing protein n=1 Tax=unclassified Actinoplanes TaxID=2626549 RepID=UPI003448D452